MKDTEIYLILIDVFFTQQRGIEIKGLLVLIKVLSGHCAVSSLCPVYKPVLVFDASCTHHHETNTASCTPASGKG